MNLVVLFLSILFALFGVNTCAVLSNPPPSSSTEKVGDSASNVGREQVGSSSAIFEKKLNENLDDHAGDHDQNQKVKARKGVGLPDDESGKVSTVVQANRNISTDRASTTVTKDTDSLASKTSEMSATTKTKEKATNSDTASSIASDKYSPSNSDKSSKTDTSHTASSEFNSSKSVENSSVSTDVSKSNTSASKSTESTSSKSSSIYKKPNVTFSVEDDPTLLNVPRVRQMITPLTPLDVKVEAADSAYLPPSSDFIDRMETKREMYIFPLVVLIFLVPMVLGVGIIILRRVRDYWSTRHYRRMDFLVDGMYNT